MPQPDYTIRQNDTGEAITAVLVDSAGDPVDLTDATIVFQLARIAGGALVVEADAEFSGDGSDGGVSYTWQAEDTAAAGWYLASWRVTLDGAIQTYPLGTYTLVQVIGELGAIQAAQAPTALWPPVGWTVNALGEVTIEFPDDPDGAYVGLTVTAPADYDFFAGVRVEDASGSRVAELSFDALNLRTGGGPYTVIGHGFAGFNDVNGDDIILIAAHSNDSDRTQDIVQFYKSSGAGGLWGVNKDGLEYFANISFAGPDDGDVATSARVHWFDDTVAAPALRFKQRDSAGTLTVGKAAGLAADGSAFLGVAKPLLGASPTVAQISTVLAGLGLTRQT